jgi:ATP-dependent RNA helicase RhlE
VVIERPTPSGAATDVASFAALGLAPPLLRALGDEGYRDPTPVQVRGIPPVLRGRDLLACAQTGTGKTAAFVLPLLQRLALGHADGTPRRTARRGIRALVLSPTRELAAQIAERTSAYGKYMSLSHAVIYGGVSQRAQEVQLRRGCDVLVATPGRLLDLAQQGVLSLDDVEILVLDEADRMLDMGFIHDVRRVLARLPSRKQTLFFSATMPTEIRRLAADILRDPETVAVTPKVTAAPTVTHAVWHVTQVEKRPLVLRVLSEDSTRRRAIVFTRTKHGANRVCEHLLKAGVSAGVIHGNKSQGARERVLDSFREGTTRVLVATDLAARGIDVDDVGLVVNYDLPNVAESYVHRIGRAGRAGADGAAVSFCDPSERPLLHDIERLLAFRISPANGEPRVSESSAPVRPTERPRQRQRQAQAQLQRPTQKAVQAPTQGQPHVSDRAVAPGESSRRRRPRSFFR